MRSVRRGNIPETADTYANADFKLVDLGKTSGTVFDVVKLFLLDPTNFAPVYPAASAA